MENPQIDSGRNKEVPIDMESRDGLINPQRNRFPYCIVWTPIPVLTWIFPFIGHMGIAMSSGVIRDFAGPYYVSEDCMAFGAPTKYWRLNPLLVKKSSWDCAVLEASDVYKHRMVMFIVLLHFMAIVHNLCCDNCHSHVALALNLMNYNNTSSWNMFKLCFSLFFYGKYVSVGSFLKTWSPFLILGVIIVIMVICVG